MLIDRSGNQQMRKLTLISPINARPLKRVSVSNIFCEEINHQSTDENIGGGASLFNQPIPLTINDNTAASARNGVSFSESEVSTVSGISGECRAWLARKWWSVCKHADLIQAILEILYQVLRNLYRVFGL